MGNELFDDDIPVGRILTRKEALLFLGGLGAATILAGCSGGSQARLGSSSSTTASSSSTSSVSSSSSSSSVAANCVAFPQVTEGPYWVDEKLNRSDIRSDPSTGTAQQGTPLSLTFYLANVTNGCGVISGATIDIWHCNAVGVYSDEAANNTSGQKWLRGYQTTDSSGKVVFTTIYPGWYSGRTTHIHFRVRFTQGGKSYDLVSQLFFDDSLNSSVYSTQPAYVAHGQKDTSNSRDSIYLSQMQLTVTGSASAGYVTTFTLGVAV